MIDNPPIPHTLIPPKPYRALLCVLDPYSRREKTGCVEGVSLEPGICDICDRWPCEGQSEIEWGGETGRGLAYSLYVVRCTRATHPVHWPLSDLRGPNPVGVIHMYMYIPTCL